MTVAMARGLLYVLSTYVAIGTLLAVPFVVSGIGRVDPAARAAPWTFRALVFPGVVAFWPLLLRRWLTAKAVR
jgi:hypothetical protein